MRTNELPAHIRLVLERDYPDGDLDQIAETLGLARSTVKVYARQIGLRRIPKISPDSWHPDPQARNPNAIVARAIAARGILEMWPRCPQ